MKASKSGGTVIKRGKAEKAFTVFNYIFFILLSIVMVYPFWHVIMMSFSSVEATVKRRRIPLSAGIQPGHLRKSI